MARTRTQKAVSRRIDLSYFKRPHPLRTGRKAFIFIVGVLTIALLTFYSAQGDARLHNPGPLTKSHAAWQHDCKVCHDGDGSGGFARTVSDASCLQCHDGALHHKNQLDTTLTKWPASQDKAMVMMMAGHVTSKDCVSCHTEHRGHELLAATNDQLCITCHADLKSNAKQAPAAQNRIVAFTTADHPRFGQDLMKDGKVTDPTVLKFNHARHNKIEVLANNCTSCHSTSETTPLASLPSATVAPPYKTENDSPAAWAKAGNKASMLPISFERNCIGCHAIEIPGKVRVSVPHEDLKTVRGFLAGVSQSYANALAAMPAADRQKELVTETRTGRPPRVVVTKKTITEQEWIDARMKELGEAIDKNFGSSDAKYAAVKKAIPAPSTQPGAPQGPNPSQVEHFVTYGVGANCNFCHEVQGTSPAVAFAGSPAKPELATIVPTGITTTPRVWYPKSNFDHNAHRFVSCLDCHAAATSSSLTSDFLSPNIDTASTNGASCVSCHKADSASASMGDLRGAPANCVTCHSFHDPLESRPPTGTFDVRAGKMVPFLSNDPNAKRADGSAGPTTSPATRPVALAQ